MNALRTLALLTCVLSVAAAPRQPDIVVIMADDFGFSDLGCYGSEIQTPNLDRLAAGGLRFTQFYNTARCCPTRASLLTGLYSHQAGVGHMVGDYGEQFPGYRGRLNDRCVTIAEALRPAGYRTLMTGKWHVGENRPHWPVDRGFDRYYGLVSGGSNFWKLDKGRVMALNDQLFTPEQSDRSGEDFYFTDAFTDYALKFVDEHAEGHADKPYFLYLAYTAPHWPLHAHPADVDKYRGKYMDGWDALRQRRHARMIELGLVDPKWPMTPRDPGVPAWDSVNPQEREAWDLRMAVYAAQIDRMDQGIGRLVRRLEELGRLDNTLILFLADNGGCAEIIDRGERGAPPGPKESFLSYGVGWANASNTPFRLYKHFVHEGGISSPLIAHWPAAIREGRRGTLTGDVGHVIDLMPTYLEAAGAEYPKTYGGKEILPVEGRSFVATLRGEKRDERGPVFWEHEGHRAVRLGKWKLVARHGHPWELYDLEADRTELNDLAAADAQRVTEMASLYDQWAARCAVTPPEVLRPPPPPLPTRAAIERLDGRVLSADASRMLADDLARRTRAAHERENEAWRGVTTRQGWEAFRDQRIQALRESLGPVRPAPDAVKVRVTRTIKGEGYRIDNLVYETRPGLVVTANLYLPGDAPAAGTMPGFLISHSHHTPKTNGELQDMGITWARLGCAVLVPDHLGHGERRQHPFATAESYPKPFKVGRQDYYFRHNTAQQLHLAGETLMGWMAWDLRRGVDVLLSHARVDPKRVVLIGAVAGGGDPAGVTAALDDRIAAVAPFNFGGPQPDYEIPENAERDFYWFGVPYWETTRCLRLAARDGFAHWVIVGSVAPRGLVYSHEFAWDRERDPAWPRLQKVFDFYGAGDRLASATGRGSLRGNSPDDTHCTHVGPVHRAGLYAPLQRWLGIEPPARGSDERHSVEELACLTPQVVEELKPRPLYELAAAYGAERSAAARAKLAGMDASDRRTWLRVEWARLLGDVEPGAAPNVLERREEKFDGVAVERVALEVEPGVVVPLLLLVPPHEPNARLPAVVAFAQQGKQALLRQRAPAIRKLLAGGALLCLADLRGTGETSLSEDAAGRGGDRVDVSQGELMLGRTLLGARLRDLRSVLRYVRERPDVNVSRTALWGDSVTPPNGDGVRLDVPLDGDDLPRRAEPLGGLLATLGMLFDDGVKVGFGRGGLVSYGSCLSSPFLYVPHDAIVPGALTTGDLDAVAAAVAPRPLRLQGRVDGLNRPAEAEAGPVPVEWILEPLGAR